MAAPNVTFTVEPRKAGSILVLELAPLTSTQLGAAQLSLRFDVHNHEPTSVHLSKITLQFSGSSVPTVNIPVDVTVNANASAEWHFQPANNIILPWPAPATLTASLTFDGYPTPVSITGPIAAHVSPVAGDAYAFPFQNGSLATGEYFNGRSGAHGAAGGGVQLFGYDMGVVAIDDDTGQWSGLHPGTNGSKNADYRIWGKPVFAMADGAVVAFADQYEANPNPPADLSPPYPVEGNHFYIQHGDELVLYAHLQLGTLPSNLKQVGASVSSGEFLGLVGNSGNSTAPHIHLHAIEGTLPWQGPLRPLPFRLAGTIGLADASGAPMTPPWVDLAGRGIPAESALVWPGELPVDWRGNLGQYVAIDPLALVLSNAVYVKLTLPDPPPIEVVRARLAAMLQRMSPAERKQTLANVQQWTRWLEGVQREIAALGSRVLNEPQSGRD
jgi:murein DD-endopeptidase MepM/ murein hydrolase activator NlpD